MDEEALNLSVRKFLKKLGVTAQREIERAVREAAAGDRLKGRTSVPAKATITLAGNRSRLRDRRRHRDSAER